MDPMIAEMGLPDNEIQGNVALFASGAAETTRAALSHGMHELMRRPDQMDWVRERQDDIPATLPQEFVRMGKRDSQPLPDRDQGRRDARADDQGG